MTNRLIIASVCLVAALTLSIVSFFYVKNTSFEFSEAASKAIEAVESGDGFEEAEKCVLLWREHHAVFGMCIKHSDADELDRLTGLIAAYYNDGNTDELIECLEEFRVALAVIYDGEKPDLENIF